MTPIEFFVEGIPAPGGSKRAIPLRRRDGSLILRPNGSPVINVVDMGGKLGKAWRKNVQYWAHRSYYGEPLDTALRVVFVFVVMRPKRHFGTGRNANVLKDSAPLYPATVPDVLKLARSTEDALTGILWTDDKLTVDLHVSKVFGTRPGVIVRVWEMEAAAVEQTEPRRAQEALFQ